MPPHRLDRSIIVQFQGISVHVHRMVDHLAASLSGVGLDWRLLSPEMQEYSRCCKNTAEKLWLVWEDMGVSKQEQELELREITQKTYRVWGEALERAEAAREQMKTGLKNAVRKTQSIVDELREEGGRELGVEQASLKTLRQEYEEALKVLRKWRQCKQDRLQQIERIKSEMHKVLDCLGIPHQEIELVSTDVTLPALARPSQQTLIYYLDT